MSLPAAVIRRMSEAGLSALDIAEIAEQFEHSVDERVAQALSAMMPKRSPAAARQAAYRERKRNAEHNGNHNARDAQRDAVNPETKVSPAPPSKTQTNTPLNPPTPSRRNPVADATASMFEEAWGLITPEMRKRSKGKPSTAQFWASTARKAGSEATLMACLKRYLREDPDVGRSGGPGFHLWLRDGKWEHYLPRPEPPGKPSAPLDAAVIAARVQHFRDTGEWKPTWGDPPTDLAA